MGNSDKRYEIEVTGGVITLKSKYNEPLKVTFQEKPCEANDWVGHDEVILHLKTDEAEDLIEALKFLKR